MDSATFKASLAVSAQQARKHAAMIETIGPYLPDFPPDVDYIFLNSPPVEMGWIELHLQMAIPERKFMRPLLKHLPPLPLMRAKASDADMSVVQPSYLLSAVTQVAGRWRPIFPVIMGTSKDDNNFFTSMLWYTRPAIIDYPGIRMMVTCLIVGENGDMYPAGDSEVFKDTATPANPQTSYQWPVMDTEAWLDKFCIQSDAEFMPHETDEWEDVLEDK